MRRGYVQVFSHSYLIVTSKDKQSCFLEIFAPGILKLRRWEASRDQRVRGAVVGFLPEGNQNSWMGSSHKVHPGQCFVSDAVQQLSKRNRAHRYGCGRWFGQFFSCEQVTFCLIAPNGLLWIYLITFCSHVNFGINSLCPDESCGLTTICVEEEILPFGLMISTE